MQTWLLYSGIAIFLWGIVGLLQKLGTNRITANSLLIWLMGGYVSLLPWLLFMNHSTLSKHDVVIGTLAGLTNGLGAWCLFSSLEKGGKAAIVIPLTALSPLVTIFFAILFLSEHLTHLQWIGVILALIAGVLISYETNFAESVSRPA
jgi:transporter family protein